MFQSQQLKLNIADSAKVVVRIFGPGGVRSLLITNGESRAAEVLRVVPFLVVDGSMGTLSSRVFPIMIEFR